MLEKTANNISAVDGEETIKIIEKNYKKEKIFEIMLFDINLPAPWDGIKLMNEIKKRWPEYNKIPFVDQTAYAMSGGKERLLEAGFDSYISKPVNKNKLINIIYNQLKIFKLIMYCKLRNFTKFKIKATFRWNYYLCNILIVINNMSRLINLAKVSA